MKITRVTAALAAAAALALVSCGKEETGTKDSGQDLTFQEQTAEEYVVPTFTMVDADGKTIEEEVTGEPVSEEEDKPVGSSSLNIGTPSSVLFRELETGLELGLTAYGTMNYDPAEGLEDDEELQQQLKLEAVSALQAQIALAAEDTPYSDLLSKLSEIEENTAAGIESLGHAVNVKITIGGISLDEESQTAYDAALGQ